MDAKDEPDFSHLNELAKPPMWVIEREQALIARVEAAERENERLRADSQFLLDRLAELEIHDDDELARNWFGHIEPAMGRLRTTLSGGNNAEPA